MSATITDYLAAIAHLPAGAALCVDDVSWDEYEQLLKDLGEGYSVRIFYDSRRMEIRSPAAIHEKPTSIIHRLVIALSDELDIDVESLGSTTFRTELKATGAEPDDCFYVQNASLIIGKQNLNLEHDPPPDIAIEIDRTNASLNKFRIYAGLGVPELWLVTKGEAHVFVLRGNSYEESGISLAFPFLSAQTLTEFIAQGLAEGERKAAKAFRKWVREQIVPPQ